MPWDNRGMAGENRVSAVEDSGAGGGGGAPYPRVTSEDGPHRFFHRLWRNNFQ
jgi:hypothetical protein